MKLVFQAFENPLALACGRISLLRIEAHDLFSRCAESLACGYSADAPEQALFFDDDNREMKTRDTLFFVGDLVTFDLNDRRLLNTALKRILQRMATEGEYEEDLKRINSEIEGVFECQFVQMSADYAFLETWDSSKYLKALGFGIDTAADEGLFGKLIHLLRVVEDLSPEKVLAFINLGTFLTSEQFFVFKEEVLARDLLVLMLETDDRIEYKDLENRLSVEADFLEY